MISGMAFQVLAAHGVLNPKSHIPPVMAIGKIKFGRDDLKRRDGAKTKWLSSSLVAGQ